MKDLIYLSLIILVIIHFSSKEEEVAKEYQKQYFLLKKENDSLKKSHQPYESLIDLVNMKEVEIRALQRDLKHADKKMEKLTGNKKFFLFLLDNELSAVEGVGKSMGSFSDFFIPTVHDALNAGNSIKEVEGRVTKLILLAEKGLFISNYEEEVFRKGGSSLIKKIIFEK